MPDRVEGRVSKIARAIRSFITGSVPLRCVHCNRPKAAVKRMIAGPAIYICDDCGRDAASAYAAVTERVTFTDCSFCGHTTRAVSLGRDRERAVCADCIELMKQILDSASDREISTQ
ncbi:MAG: ClpX C4-type zinc finger protein [Gemmatimonadaceae bacterium]